MLQYNKGVKKMKDKVQITLREYSIIIRSLNLLTTYIKEENDIMISDQLKEIRKLKQKIFRHYNKLVDIHNERMNEYYEF